MYKNCLYSDSVWCLVWLRFVLRKLIFHNHGNIHGVKWEEMKCGSGVTIFRCME